MIFYLFFLVIVLSFCRVLLGVNHLQDKTFGGSLRAHLRDSVRIPKTLQHHLSREALPKIDHYHPQVPTGSRPTLEELYLGEAPENKVIGTIFLLSIKLLVWKLANLRIS